MRWFSRKKRVEQPEPDARGHIDTMAEIRVVAIDSGIVTLAVEGSADPVHMYIGDVLTVHRRTTLYGRTITRAD